MASSHTRTLGQAVLSVVLLLLASTACGASNSGKWNLTSNFYSRSCRRFESIVQQRVQFALGRGPLVAAALLRIAFHDCHVNGCDASVLRDSAKKDTERYATPNLTLRLQALELLNEIKGLLDRECGPVVSCADIIAAATRDATVVVGGPRWNNTYGRRDGSKSTKDAANRWLPSGRMIVNKKVGNLSSLITNFRTVGLNATDLVVLSGAHTLGVGHCFHAGDRIPTRLGGYANSPLRSKFNRTYQADVENTCSDSCNRTVRCDRVANPADTPTTNLDANFQSTTTFDNSYFKSVLTGEVLLTSDIALAHDKATVDLVRRFARDQGAFFRAFSASMIKMLAIQPATLKGGNGLRLPVYKDNTYGVRRGTCS